MKVIKKISYQVNRIKYVNSVNYIYIDLKKLYKMIKK